MSDRPRFPAADARKVAHKLALDLVQACYRVEIVGSLRRQKPWVGDIELLFIPKMGDAGTDFFDRIPISLADELINGWLKSSLLAKRPNKAGALAWGPHNKLAVHLETGIPVDLFATTEQNWWNALVYRTGGKQSNLRLTGTAIRKGYSFEAYGAVFRNLYGGPSHLTTSERDVFEFIGLPYLEPKDRP